MRKITFLTLLFLAVGLVSLQAHDDRPIKSTKQLLKVMKKRYKGKWFKSFTFVQETIRYDKEGNPQDPKLWYEAIKYPNKFRIDFGEINNGNANLYAADSAYFFRKGALKKTRFEPKYFLLMKGGLYFYKIKKSLDILQKGGYDTNNFYETVWNGRPVYVIGAKQDDLKTQQFWLDKKDLYMVRRISLVGKNKDKVLDVQYSDHKATGGGWVEQKVTFYVDGRLVQIENYKKIDTKPNLPKGVFSPQQFGKVHWVK